MSHRVGTGTLRLLGWAAALVGFTGLGLVAVGTVGDAARGSGPLGAAVIRVDAPPPPTVPATPPPGLSVVRGDLTHDFGTFTVSCTGPYAAGESAEAGQGWQVVRFEPGPDDDVEVVFASETELVELEAFCNRGRPEVAELDRSRVTAKLGGSR
ncbi:MAG: hypothetical protein ACT4QF_05795 [Sporichthyaceae bacterium]